MIALAPDHDLLVRAALSEDPDAAATAYRCWRADLDVERLGGAELRMLPLLIDRFATDARDDPIAERLRRVTRFSWLAGQLLLSRSLPVIEALQAAGVPVVATKGAAVIHHARVNPGIRPIEDLDLLVPIGRVAEAATAIRSCGLRASHPLHGGAADRLLELRPSLNFEDGEGAQVDLHWHLLHCSRHPEADAGFLERAGQGRFRHLDCMILSPEDTLLNVVEHGYPWAMEPTLRWTSDAMLLIRRCELDWDLVVRTSRAHRFGARMADAMDYLAGSVGAPVPAEALREMRRVRPNAAQWHRRRRGTDPRDGGPRLPDAVGRALDSWDDHAARSLPPASAARPRDVVSWLREIWLLPREAAVPAGLAFAAARRPWRLRRILGAHRRAARRHGEVPPYALGEALDFDEGGSGLHHLVAGWDAPGGGGVWTRGGAGRIVLAVPPGSAGPLSLELDCGLVLTAFRPRAELELIADGRHLASRTLEGSTTVVRLRAELPDPGPGPIEILLRTPEPVIPVDARVPGTDRRQLGVFITRLRLAPADAERPVGSGR